MKFNSKQGAANNNRNQGKSKKAFKPLVRPTKHPSRKQARRLTTEFHRLTTLRDAAEQAKDEAAVLRYNEMIDAMGGREEYQRASQTSTSFFSTSKWVLGYLSRNGWLYGIVNDKQVTETMSQKPPTTEGNSMDQTDTSKERPRKRRRPTRILEVGAINTELLDAAEKPRNNLNVRALDLHSMNPNRIEENDFLKIPVPANLYDVVVCSMVLNSVTTAEKRGEMLVRLSKFLLSQGLLFLTLPRSCLNASPYMDDRMFQKMIEYCNLEVIETKESPKIAFFICRKISTEEGIEQQPLPLNWTVVRKIREGKKYRNQFAVVMPNNESQQQLTDAQLNDAGKVAKSKGV